jgi:hypothetical protein
MIGNSVAKMQWQISLAVHHNTTILLRPHEADLLVLKCCCYVLLARLKGGGGKADALGVTGAQFNFVHFGDWIDSSSQVLG